MHTCRYVEYIQVKLDLTFITYHQGNLITHDLNTNQNAVTQSGNLDCAS